ncbi:MAG: DegV family protein [Caldilineaceae bacterium]|nr:DegV family protein [Caldilineaceae bacterium]
MSKIAIMTDSTCGLPAHIIKEENLIVVPCQVRIGEDVYKEGVDLTAQELFDRLYSSVETPTTSLPAGEDYAAAFVEAQRRGADQILGLFVGSTFSGTFNGARLAAQDQPLPVELVDSGTTAIALGLLVLEAARMVRTGADLQQAATDLREMATRTELYALLDTLEYIRRGGRIGRVGELIANVLNIKPVLRVARNSLDVVARARSRKKGLAWLMDTAREASPLISAGVMHINVPGEAEEMAREVSQLVEGKPKLLIEPVTAAVAVHAGPHAIGMGFIK